MLMIGNYLFRDIENIEEDWNRIHIHIVKKPKEKIENEVIFRQV